MPTSSTLEGDADRLQQVLCNLLASSLKLTSASGQVALSIERRGEGVEISVTDTGAGIAPECLPYVFDVFRRAGGASPRRASGLGIGLAIVPLLVGMHGGTVTVESDGLGKGARFVVRLPQAGPSVSLGASRTMTPRTPSPSWPRWRPSAVAGTGRKASGRRASGRPPEPARRRSRASARRADTSAPRASQN